MFERKSTAKRVCFNAAATRNEEFEQALKWLHDRADETGNAQAIRDEAASWPESRSATDRWRRTSAIRRFWRADSQNLDASISLGHFIEPVLAILDRPLDAQAGIRARADGVPVFIQRDWIVRRAAVHIDPANQRALDCVVALAAGEELKRHVTRNARQEAGDCVAHQFDGRPVTFPDRAELVVPHDLHTHLMRLRQNPQRHRMACGRQS